MWLKWRHDARESYVLGYFERDIDGHGDGCEPGVKAGAREVDSDHLVKSVTDFYTRYPEDREIYIREVIGQLGRGLTLEQIHNYAFLRRRTPPPQQ
jgi:hypothetical protein